MRTTWRVRSRSATALARQSARSAGDTRAEAATVRRSAIRTRRHDEMGASPPPANSAGARAPRGIEGGWSPSPAPAGDPRSVAPKGKLAHDL